MRALYPEMPLARGLGVSAAGQVPLDPLPRRGAAVRENLALCRASLQGRPVRLSGAHPAAAHAVIGACGRGLSARRPGNSWRSTKTSGTSCCVRGRLPTIVAASAGGVRATSWSGSFRPAAPSTRSSGGCAHPGRFRRPSAWMAALAEWTALGAPRPAFANSAAAPDSAAGVATRNLGGDSFAQRQRTASASACPSSSRRSNAAGGEVIVSDNGSDDGTRRVARPTYPGMFAVMSNPRAALVRARSQRGHRSRPLLVHLPAEQRHGDRARLLLGAPQGFRSRARICSAPLPKSSSSQACAAKRPARP